MFFVFSMMLSGGCLVWAGQIELYTHLPVMRQLVEHLQQSEFRVCGVFLVDSQFMVESFKVTWSQKIWRREAGREEKSEKAEFHSVGTRRCDAQPLLCPHTQFISGVMAALSAMVSLEIPQVNIMTKMDLLSAKAKKEIEKSVFNSTQFNSNYFICPSKGDLISFA